MEEKMTFDEALEYINEIGKKGSVLGLGPVTELLKRLDDPQEKIDIIHVAGTNGKGSICTFLEMMYREEGKVVGRYISPTINDYLERFQINGNYMKEADFTRLFERVYDAIVKMENEGLNLPTAFEIETAIAFLYFEESDIDLVILEVGMGGREDATNVIKHPICTVFANIGMDHMQYLGDTIEKIAYEKAGIIKNGCPAVSYPSEAAVIEVLRGEYDRVNQSNSGDRDNDGNVSVKYNEGDINGSLNNNFIVADTNNLDIIEEDLTGSTFIYNGEEYSISLAGKYQILNAITAIETKLLLDGKLKKEALLKVSWEGRFEKISDEPLFIRDGAHNIQGVTALKESLSENFTDARYIFIIGVLKDKEYEKMMELLCPMAETCYLIRPDNPRGLDTKTLKAVVDRYCDDVTRCDTVEEAIGKAVEKTVCKTTEEVGGNVFGAGYNNVGGMKNEDKAFDKKQSVIVAWGSLSYIGKCNRKILNDMIRRY